MFHMCLTINLLILNIHQMSVGMVDRPTKKVKTEPIVEHYTAQDW